MKSGFVSKENSGKTILDFWKATLPQRELAFLYITRAFAFCFDMVYSRDMKDIKSVVARNIVFLRKQNGLTQIALAEKINYSDKAVSRWESGDVTPDVETLNHLAEIFGTDIASLFNEALDTQTLKKQSAHKNRNRFIITMLSVSLVWIVATIIYVLGLIIFNYAAWQVYIYSIPASFIVAVVFAAKWGTKFLIYFIVSLLMWSVLSTLYIIFLRFNIWPVFILGAPLQIAIYLRSKMQKDKI